MLLDIRNRSRLLTGPQAWQVSPSVKSRFEYENEHADMLNINVEYPSRFSSYMKANTLY
jgi:hypothetical protein